MISGEIPSLFSVSDVLYSMILHSLSASNAVTVVSVCAAYTALYDYQSTDDRDLTFVAGDVIMVHEMSGAWWTGSIGDRSGMFPANYIAPVNSQL